MRVSSDAGATHVLRANDRASDKLFAQFERAAGAAVKSDSASRICTELEIHTQIEEEIFYPALDGKIGDDLLKQAHGEHDGAKPLINKIAQHTLTMHILMPR